MFKRMVFLVFTGIFLISQLQPGAAVQAAAPEFFAAPAAVAGGGDVTFSGYGFTPDDVVELHLMTTPSQSLGIFSTDSSGQFTAPVTIAENTPGVYQVMAAPNDVFTTLTILPALTIDLLPIVGPPGTIVHFTVNNLAAGQLRLDYAGTPVFGPVEAGAGTFEGDFLVPGDRPDPLGTDAQVTVFNLLGSQIIGKAGTFFVSQAPDPSPYTITDLVMPVDPVLPGYPFTVSGKISPAPAGPPSGYTIKMLWKSASGQVAPITKGTPVLLPDGSFSANAVVPSLLGGDPLIPEAGGQVGVAFISMNNGSQSLVQNVAWGIQPPDPVFKVKVVDPGGNPIPNVIVDIRAFYSDFKKLDGETTGGLTLGNQLSNLEVQENQITSFLGALSTGESDPFTCEQTNVYGRTNLQGEFAVKFDPALLAAMGEKIFLGYLPKPTYMEAPMEITFPLYVNGTHAGFGVYDASNNVVPEPFTLKIRFSAYTNHFFKADNNTLLNTNPLLVTLQPLPVGTKNLVPIVPKITGFVPVGGFKNYLGTGYPMTAFGNFYSFPEPQFPDAWFTNTSPIQLRIEFQHDTALYGALDESKGTFKLLGQTYPFVNMGKKFTGQVGCDAIVYRAIVPDYHRFSAGNYTGLVEIYDTAIPANITRHYIQLNFVPAPTWIQSDKYKVRKISVGGNFVSLIASQYPPGDPASSSNLDTNVPKVGSLQNRVSNQDEVRQFLYPDKTSGISFDGYFSSTVLDEDADSKSTKAAVAGGSEITFGPSTQTVLDTGKVPLYRHVFGIPPIAGATIGADMWFDATLTYDGKVKFLGGGGTSTTLNITPTATVGVDAFFDGEVLFGLVDAEAHAVPSIGLKMPTQFIDGSLNDSTRCFLYKLDVKWEVSAGVWPFEVSKSGTEHVFNGSNPDPCSLPSGSPAVETVYLPSAETPAPPAASPALAVDGFGHTLLLWAANGSIQSRPMSGGQAGVDTQVTTTGASSDPQVAYYAPNKAVAVWTESSLTALQSQTATLSERIEAQRLQFALWNGASWTAPVNLTLPADSHGEGKSVLAGCLSTKAGCPAAGAAALVWVRSMDPAADLAQRQFRLYTSAFNGSAWSAPQAVDPASSAADAEAAVAYLGSGIPLAVWVRDADRSLATLDDRRIAYRQLAPGQPVVVETGLPTRVVEPSLAVNAQDEMMLSFTVATDPEALVGNQRQLHAAKQTCQGGCTWVSQALVDTNNRPVHAENPHITLNNTGQAQISYRALGFGLESPGGPTVMKGDALGTILGTGEIAQAFVDFSSSVIAPSYITSAGSTVWQVNAVFDPLFNQVYTAGALGSSPVLGAQTLQDLGEAGYHLEAQTTGPVVTAVVPAAPDLMISDVSLSTLYPVEGGDLEAVVSIINNGEASRTEAVVKLTWDGPAGLGVPAGEASIPVTGAGTLTLVEFSTLTGSLALPAFPHLPHTLYVQVNPNQTLPESDYTNNLKTLSLGGLPAPQGLEGAAQPGDSSVFLHWLAVEHPAVAGYRIYRSSDGRLWEPVGSAFGTGFVDLSAVEGQVYQYAAAAYSADGYESPLSSLLLAEVGNLYPVFVPLIIR